MNNWQIMDYHCMDYLGMYNDLCERRQLLQGAIAKNLVPSKAGNELLAEIQNFCSYCFEAIIGNFPIHEIA